jgi:hypothetical protein
VLKKLANWLKGSQHFHLRQGDVSTLSDLVGLLDRFLGNNSRYPLEWDDFVSWKNSAPAIESIRERIAATEPLFFSADPDDRVKGAEIILEERNRAAAMVGEPARTLHSYDAA